MRLLLLLSALLTALAGAAGTTAAAAQPVESSAGVSQTAKAGAAAHVAATVLAVASGGFVDTPPRWRPIVARVARSSHETFGERRRE